MDWIPTQTQFPPDTLGRAALWLCDEEGNVFEGGYLKYEANEPEEDGEFTGHGLGVAILCWRHKREGESSVPLPPLLPQI